MQLSILVLFKRNWISEQICRACVTMDSNSTSDRSRSNMTQDRIPWASTAFRQHKNRSQEIFGLALTWNPTVTAFSVCCWSVCSYPDSGHTTRALCRTQQQNESAYCQRWCVRTGSNTLLVASCRECWGDRSSVTLSHFWHRILCACSETPYPLNGSCWLKAHLGRKLYVWWRKQIQCRNIVSGKSKMDETCPK